MADLVFQALPNTVVSRGRLPAPLAGIADKPQALLPSWKWNSRPAVHPMADGIPDGLAYADGVLGPIPGRALGVVNRTYCYMITGRRPDRADAAQRLSEKTLQSRLFAIGPGPFVSQSGGVTVPPRR